MSLVVKTLELEGPQAHKSSPPVAPPVDAALVWTMSGPSEITLATGTTLRGLDLTYEDGTALMVGSDDVWCMLVRSETTSTISHLDGLVDVGSKITTSTGADVVIGPQANWLRYRYNGVSWAWHLEP